MRSNFQKLCCDKPGQLACSLIVHFWVTNYTSLCAIRPLEVKERVLSILATVDTKAIIHAYELDCLLSQINDGVKQVLMQ